ncbi:MAG TPA: HDOD domain-containing protein [Polyangiales bacterium]
MFAWLTRIFGGPEPQAAKSRPAAKGAPAGAPRPQPANLPKPAAKPEPAKQDDGYLSKLAAQLGEPVGLTPEEEQETSALIEDISYFVGTHRIDPPVMPAVATRMLELTRQDEVDVHALSRLIEKDQATAAKLLSIANSAVFKGNSEITGLREAIVFLGTEQVAQIAIGLASRAVFDGPNKVGANAPRFSRMFNHAMTTAFAACQIASRRNRRHSESAFLGGLFHDVGKAVALRAIDEMTANKGATMPPEHVIDAALYQIHADPSASLYEAWKLPSSLMQVCKNHHRLAVDTPPELHVVRLVSGLDALRNGANAERREALTEVSESAAALGLSDAELRVADQETKEFAERVKMMF